MRNPFRRTPPRDPQVEQALRHSLTDHARQAPAGHDLADRVFATVERTPAHDPQRDPSRWRTWAFPLIAAGAVATVVGAVAGIQQLDKPSAHGTAAASPSVPNQSVSNAPPTVATSPTTHPPSVHSSPTTTTTAPVDTSTLHDVKILDLTFADVDDGWALASADCIGGPGRCPAVLRTHDGKDWQSAPLVGFNVPGQTGGCADPCVEHLRFATDDIGYAFGPTTLEMTTDGGLHWAEQSGGALFLETLKQNVIRVTSSHTGCPGPCDIRVQTAGLGSSSWTTQLGPLNTAGDVQFARGGDDAYLLLTGHVAGGGENAPSTLYRSADDGASWQQGGEPCPQLDREDDSSAIAAGANGGVAVLCTPHGQVSHQFVATSTDHGANFSAQLGRIPYPAEQLVGDPSTVLLATGVAAERSTDAGRSWAPVPGPIDRPSFVGFESVDVGRIVAQKPSPGSHRYNIGTLPQTGTVIWTTRDGGQSWTKVQFH
jgi:hypothetical protein